MKCLTMDLQVTMNPEFPTVSWLLSELPRPKVNEKIFFKDFIYLFLETGEWREKERERNINV